jgi:hypothetical protein
MDILAIIFLILLVNTYLIKALVNRFDIASERYLWVMFIVHFLMTSAYMLYAYFTASDSVAYYDTAQASEEWLVFFKTGTPFIHFLAWPFIAVIGLSYYAVMLLFSYFGYLAVLYFYVTARENIKLKPVLQTWSATELIFLLPNLHFWTSSLGKGSPIVFGLAMFTFGLSRFNRRLMPILIGSVLVFFIRPHIFFTLVAAVMVGIFVTRSGIKSYLKWLIFLLALFLFIYFSGDVLKFTDTESLDITSSSVISHRAEELSKSGSGVNIKEYGIVMKLLTFWFRPLFFDGQGAFGIIVSFENLVYIFMFIMLLWQGALHWVRWNGWFRICTFIFFMGSFILAQVTGNLGLAMRQKAQFMPFFFIIFLYALSYRYRDQANKVFISR